MAWEAKPTGPLAYRDWPAQHADMTPAEIVSAYNSGLAGAIYDPAGRAQMLAGVSNPNGESVAYASGFAGSGDGKLVLLYLYAWRKWPRVWPSPAQTTGSCVSKAGKNIAVVLIGVEAALGQPDEVTGKIEDFPEISAEAEAQGVVASEPIYGARGHSGQGASCGTLQRWMMTEGGILLRKNYPELSLDLTVANDSIGARWGGGGTPDKVAAVGKEHQFRTATDAENWEIGSDFVANGYPLWVCSSLGWSSSRDEFGYSRQQGSWSHSWIVDGFDRRASTIQKYGFPLFHYTHDWGRWNSGGRDVRDSASLVPAAEKAEWISKGLVNPATGNILIPEGSFWGDARLLNRCDLTAMASVNGWPRRKLPDFGATGIV